VAVLQLVRVTISEEPGSSAGTAAYGQAARDKFILRDPTDVCHPEDNVFGHLPCKHVPINGGTWWFRYKLPGTPCQLSYNFAINGRFCPDGTLRGALLNGDIRINIVYVFYNRPGQDNPVSHFPEVYREKRAEIANALESNTCPSNALDQVRLFPTLKFPIGC
jgi:hypothetical protein